MFPPVYVRDTVPTEKKGAVYTRDWVVDFILDLVGYTSDRDLSDLFAVEPAAGSITARIEYAGAPLPIPADVLEGTRALVSDQTASLVLGEYYCSLSDARLVAARLATGRTYELLFTAPGYSTASATVALTSGAEQEISVIMQKIVANETLSWSGIKSLYR